MGQVFKSLILLLLLVAWAGPAWAEDGKPQDPAMRFVVVRSSLPNCEPNCPEWISAEGRIMPGTAGQFAAFMAADPLRRKLPVLLNSGGGSIRDAMAMGQLIRKEGMSTAVGKSIIFGCPQEDLEAGKCKPDPALGAFNGVPDAARAFCASACPLVLLGGKVRVVDRLSFVGLHEPVAQSTPYIDHFLIRYRIVNGRKEELSRKFVKRTYLPQKTETGITPRMRQLLSPYLQAMGGSLAMLDEMQKAAPKDMNWITFASGEREKLGLVTVNTATLDQLVAADICKPGGIIAANCIMLKPKPGTASPAALPLVAALTAKPGVATPQGPSGALPEPKFKINTQPQPCDHCLPRFLAIYPLWYYTPIIDESSSNTRNFGNVYRALLANDWRTADSLVQLDIEALKLSHQDDASYYLFHLTWLRAIAKIELGYPGDAASMCDEASAERTKGNSSSADTNRFLIDCEIINLYAQRDKVLLNSGIEADLKRVGMDDEQAMAELHYAWALRAAKGKRWDDAERELNRSKDIASQLASHGLPQYANRLMTVLNGAFGLPGVDPIPRSGQNTQTASP